MPDSDSTKNSHQPEYLDQLPDDVEKAILLTEHDLEKLENGESLAYPYGDQDIVLGIMDRVETDVEEDRYYVE